MALGMNLLQLASEYLHEPVFGIDSPKNSDCDTWFSQNFAFQLNADIHIVTFWAISLGVSILLVRQ